MKRFIILSLLSLSAQAACDYEIRDRMFRSPEQQREFKCDKNFACLETIVRDPYGSLDEVDTLVEYSRANQCNDELKITELFANLIWEDDEKQNELHIDNSERGNTKFDLPVIPDAPVDSASKTQRQ